MSDYEQMLTFVERQGWEHRIEERVYCDGDLIIPGCQMIRLFAEFEDALRLLQRWPDCWLAERGVTMNPTGEAMTIPEALRTATRHINHQVSCLSANDAVLFLKGLQEEVAEVLKAAHANAGLIELQRRIENEQAETWE